MSRFSYMQYADEPELATAIAPDNQALGRTLRSGGTISDWERLRLEASDGVLVDYLANSFAFRLCSDRLCDVLSTHAAESDSIQWLPATVVASGGHELAYWVLHFPEAPSVLHAGSITSGPVIVKAVLDSNLVDGHRLFGLPRDSLRLIMADELRSEIEFSGLTGMKFSPVPIR